MKSVHASKTRGRAGIDRRQSLQSIDQPRNDDTAPPSIVTRASYMYKTE